LTASTSEAYSYLFRLLTDPGDMVFLPRPSYPLFDFLTGLNDLETKSYHLIERNGWAIADDQWDPDLTPVPKAVLAVNPNNPTGSYVSPPELKVLNVFCAGHQAALISDEVFFDYVLDEQAARASLVENKEVLTFVLNGLSKTLGLPQMKLSWIVINGPDDLVGEARKRLEVIADTYLSVSTPVQNALPQLFELRACIQSEVINRIRTNLAFLQDASETSGKLECLKVQGGWSAVMRLPADIDEEAFVLDLLEKEWVLVHPGYFFDFDQQPLVVVSLLPQEDLFQEGLSRILKRL